MAVPGNTGIYEIVNLVSGNRYVGSAINLPRRQLAHFRALKLGKHHCSRLQAAWKKYEPSVFDFRVLELCSAEALINREQYYIDELRPRYNVSPTAGSLLGFRFSEEQRAKRRGRKRSPESVALTAAAHRGRKRTQATREKIAAKARGRQRSPDAIERGATKLRGKKRSQESTRYLVGNKHALGHKHSDQWKAANSARWIGVARPKSPEQRAKISASLKGVIHSPERRATQAAGQKGKKRGPYKLDPNKADQRRLAGKNSPL